MRTLKILALALSVGLGVATSAFAGGAYVGVYLIEETENTKGAVIEGVKEGSPAAKVGLKKGDLIVKFNGKKTPNGAALIKQIMKAEAGAKVEVVAERDGWRRKFSMTLGANNPEAAERSKPKKAPKSTAKSSEPGFLGIYLAQGEGKGAVVDGTVKGSPAREVGLKKGDVIVGIGDKRVETEQDLIAQLQGSKVGDKINLRVAREGWVKKVTVTLGRRPAREDAQPAPKPTPKPAPKAEKQPGFLGVALNEANGKVTIDEVSAGSPADKSALKKGDVILSINGAAISSIDGLAKVMTGKYAGDELTIVISRDGWKRTVKLTLGVREE